MQPGNSDYAKVAIEEGRVFFDVYHYAMANTQTRIPGYFIMFGGPSFGPSALVNIIKHYGWQQVAIYYQNVPSEVVTAETFVSLALLEGVEFELQKRESSTEEGRRIDYQDLHTARSNIYIFFGGSQLKVPAEPPATICAPSCNARDCDLILLSTQVLDVLTIGRASLQQAALRLPSFAAVRLRLQ